MDIPETPSDADIKELRRKVDEHPTDFQRRFDLGVALFRCRRYGEAIGELQKAQMNPHRRIEAMRLMADCFEARRLFDVAERMRKNIARESGEDSDEGAAPVPVPKPPVIPPSSFRAERRFDEDDRTV